MPLTTDLTPGDGGLIQRALGLGITSAVSTIQWKKDRGRATTWLGLQNRTFPFWNAVVLVPSALVAVAFGKWGVGVRRIEGQHGGEIEWEPSHKKRLLWAIPLVSSPLA